MNQLKDFIKIFKSFLLKWTYEITLEQSFSRFTYTFRSFQGVFGVKKGDLLFQGHLVSRRQRPFWNNKWCRQFGFISGSTISGRQSDRMSDLGLSSPHSPMNLFCGFFFGMEHLCIIFKYSWPDNRNRFLFQAHQKFWDVFLNIFPVFAWQK